MQLLDGKKTAEDIKNEIAAEVQSIKDAGGKVPHLAAVIVGTNGASLTYVGSKVKSCQQIGFDSTLVSLPEDSNACQIQASKIQMVICMQKRSNKELELIFYLSVYLKKEKKKKKQTNSKPTY